MYMMETDFDSVARRVGQMGVVGGVSSPLVAGTSASFGFPGSQGKSRNEAPAAGTLASFQARDMERVHNPEGVKRISGSSEMGLNSGLDIEGILDDDEEIQIIMDGTTPAYFCSSLGVNRDLFPKERQATPEGERQAIMGVLGAYVIDCLSKNVDPRATHKYYFLVNHTISMLLEGQFLANTSEATNTVWVLLEDLVKTRLESVADAEKQKMRRDANTRNGGAPPLPEATRRWGGAILENLTAKLEESVKWFVLNCHSKGISPEGDIRTRTDFFKTWCLHMPEGSKTLNTYMDYFWRALMFRTPDYYAEPGTTPGMEVIPSAKIFNLDHLMKILINKCVEGGVDPRQTHRFYFTIYFCLESGWMPKLTAIQSTFVWQKYHAWAATAVEEGSLEVEVDVGGKEETVFFEDVKELPPAPTFGVKGRLLQYWSTNKGYYDQRKSFSKLMKKYIGEHAEVARRQREKSGRTVSMEEDWENRRVFFLDYIYFMPQGLSENFVDKCWREYFQNVYIV